MWLRWNQTSNVFEKSTDDGAIWTSISLDAMILTQGVLEPGRIPPISNAMLAGGIAFAKMIGTDIILQESQIVGLEDDLAAAGGPHHATHEPGGTDAIAGAAWLALANVFTANQQITKVRPELQIQISGETVKNRVFGAAVTGGLCISNNLYYDGANWMRDDTTLSGFLVNITPVSCAWYGVTGVTANPAVLKPLMSITSAGLSVVGQVIPRVFTTTSLNPAPNVDITDLYELTALGGAPVFNNPIGTPTNGQKLMFRIYGAAAWAFTWGSAYIAGGASLPATSVAAKWLTMGFIYNATLAKWQCVAVSQEV